MRLLRHFSRTDPGECPICGAAHCSCGGGPILVEQLPATAAAARALSDPLLGTVAAPAAAGEAGDSAPPLGDGSDDRPVSTGTYRGQHKKPRGPSSRS